MAAKKRAPSRTTKRAVKPRRPPPRGRVAPRAKPKRPVASRRSHADREAIATLESEVRRLRSARTKLERRLTAAVQEIGMLRQFELRADMLEREIAKRDGELTRLRAELAVRLGGASIVSAP